MGLRERGGEKMKGMKKRREWSLHDEERGDHRERRRLSGRRGGGGGRRERGEGEEASVGSWQRRCLIGIFFFQK